MPSSLNGTGVTFNDGSTLQSGAIPAANLGSGTADVNTFLRGNRTYANFVTSTATALNATGSAPIYACRAWVNFNGTGTVAIRASGNVTSISDNGTGDYTVNFTTAMPDANYTPVCFGNRGSSAQVPRLPLIRTDGTLPTTSALRIEMVDTSSIGLTDQSYINVAIFR